MKVQIILIGSPFVISIELPEGTNYVQWCKLVKADGGIYFDHLHVPYDKIAGMGLGDFVKQQTAPSTEAVQ